MKVFVVWKQEVVYDEYDSDPASIVGVFSTKKKADLIAKRLYAEVEEFELDKDRQ